MGIVVVYPATLYLTIYCVSESSSATQKYLNPIRPVSSRIILCARYPHGLRVQRTMDLSSLAICLARQGHRFCCSENGLGPNCPRACSVSQKERLKEEKSYACVMSRSGTYATSCAPDTSMSNTRIEARRASNCPRQLKPCVCRGGRTRERQLISPSPQTSASRTIVLDGPPPNATHIYSPP
jgi:hypothetical protein